MERGLGHGPRGRGRARFSHPGFNAETPPEEPARIARLGCLLVTRAEFAADCHHAGAEED